MRPEPAITVRTSTKLGLFAVSLLVSLVLGELAARLVYLTVDGQLYSAERLHALSPDLDPTTLKRLEIGNLPRRATKNVMHPYLGFVGNATEAESGRHGFATAMDPIQQRGDGRLLVGVFGGSVAEGLARYLQAELESRVATAPTPVEVAVITLAMGGYKQPQQLLTLAYLTSLGAEFDVVVNVDGYNEVALSTTENYDHGVFPFFPRAWGLYVGMEKSSKNFVLAGKIKYLRGLEADLHRDVAKSPFRRSAAYGLLKRRAMVDVVSGILDGHRELLAAELEGYEFEKSGPRVQYGSREELLRELAHNWRRSSLAMSQLAGGLGFEYYHVLQPNQHLPAIKVLTSAEQALFARPPLEAVIVGYPLLQAEVPALARGGVELIDATRIYADVGESVFSDDCCHLNELGNQLLARHVVSRILRDTELASLRAAR